MSNLPAQTSPLLCSDEDIAVRAGGDYITLVPPWQLGASGSDGFFAPTFPWVLNSTAVDFEAYGVLPNQVVLLTAPKSYFPGGGQILAIDTVAGTSCTLRRLHQDLNVGQPPAPIAGLTGVAFSVPTLLPQIDDASFEIKRRYGVDETNLSRSSSYVFDLRDLRSATILTVLLERYIFETRTREGDFSLKIARVKTELDLVLSRVQVRWGPTSTSQEPSSMFGMKICR